MGQYNLGSLFNDITGEYLELDLGNRYILVAMVYFTKWMAASAIPIQETTTVADIRIKSIISCFGVRLELHLVKDPNFEGELFHNICNKLGMRRTRTRLLHLSRKEW